MSNLTPPPDDNPRSSKQAGVLTAVIVIVAIAAIAAGWIHWSVPSPSRFKSMVDALTSGSLRDVPTGQVSVARTFPGLTPRDEIFVTRRPDGSFMAVFPTYYNKGTDLGGLLYTSRPLRPEDTYSKAGGLNIDKRRINVGTAKKLFIDARIDEHWYRFSHGLE